MARRTLAFSIGLDIASLLGAIVIASLVTFQTPFAWQFRSDATVMTGAMLGGGLFGLYVATRSAGRGVPRPSYGRAITMTTVMLVSTAFAILGARAFWSRNFITVATLALLAMTLGHRALRRWRPWSERLALVTNEKGLVDHLMGAPHANVVGVLDPAGVVPDRPLPPATTLAVDPRAVLSDDMARFVSSCNLAGVPMRSLASVYEEHTGRVAIVHLYEGWEVTVPLENRGTYVKTKRIIDTAIVAVLSPIALTLGLLSAIAIKIDSRGPVIYRQRRVGLEGKPFILYKFRTMRVGSAGEASFAAKRDNRLTRVGKVLRRFRSDELPQLWNVLKGDLSLVGPRPEQGPFVDRFSNTIPFYTHRHLVRPGITGWAQVNFGYADSQADTVEKLLYDLYYIKHVSPWLDLEVLGRSVWTILSGFGAR